jgi:hypothetical protein
MSVWLSPALAGRGVPPPIHAQFLAPQLTLRLAPLWGLDPLFTVQPRLPLGGTAALASNFALRYTLGRVQTGTSLSFSRDHRGLLLNSLSFVRYVAPTYHLGIQDRAVWPIASYASTSHALTAAAGLKPTPGSPALRVSSTLSKASEPHWAGALSGFF